MDEEKLNQALYDKMFGEQENFREKLLTLPPKEILDRAYEYALREDILYSQEFTDHSVETCKALLERKNLLEDLTNYILKQDSPMMEMIPDAIAVYAKGKGSLGKEPRSTGDAR